MLGWVHQLEENRAVIVLHDDSPLDVWLAAARHLHEEWRIDAIAALAEIDQDKAAAIALDLGVPFHSPETVARVNDKVAMRTALNGAGVESIPFAQVASLGVLEDFFFEHGAPLLLKPAKGRASAGVAVVRSKADLKDAFHLTRDAKAPRLEQSMPIVERYVEGPEFSVETITHEGVHYIFGIAEKFKDDRTKVELGHVVPERISEHESDTLVAHIRRCLTAMIRQGLTHSEVILGADGPVFVETHLREAGDQIIELVEAATGVDLTELLLQQIAGVDLAQSPEVRARQAARELPGRWRHSLPGQGRGLHAGPVSGPGGCGPDRRGGLGRTTARRWLPTRGTAQLLLADRVGASPRGRRRQRRETRRRGGRAYLPPCCPRRMKVRVRGGRPVPVYLSAFFLTNVGVGGFTLATGLALYKQSGTATTFAWLVAVEYALGLVGQFVGGSILIDATYSASR